MASLVSRLPLCAPVQSTIPRFASFPDSPSEHKCGVQTQGWPRYQAPLVSTSAEYNPRDNVVPRIIEGNQFRKELAQVVTSFVQTLHAPCMDTVYLYLNCGCVGDIPMTSLLSDRIGR